MLPGCDEQTLSHSRSSLSDINTQILLLKRVIGAVQCTDTACVRQSVLSVSMANTIILRHSFY